MIGIGGSSMSGLAELLVKEGYHVSGSDRSNGYALEKLRKLGVTVHVGHAPENVHGADLVVYTAAILPDNPERVEMERLGLPNMERAELLGQLMEGYAQAVGVCGTHGKTTTTSMLSQILVECGKDPTVHIGGQLDAIGGSTRIGHGDTFLAEACEFKASFHHMHPTMAVVTNIEEDHLDFFKDLEDVEHSFRAFADLVPDGGYIVANCEDANTMKALEGETRPMITFGVEKGDVHAENLEMNHGFATFDVVYRDQVYAHVELSIPGMHNVKNVLAASAAAAVLGVPGWAVEQGMRDFRLPGRRFEYKGDYNGAEVCDDYAHHPGELEVLLDSAKSLGHKRVICAFQPHTYTRTHELFDDFVEVLKLPDKVLLAEIFAARETDTLGISSKDLADRIPRAEYCPTLEDVTDRLAQLAQPGDLLLTVGAGDIHVAGERLLERAE